MRDAKMKSQRVNREGVCSSHIGVALCQGKHEGIVQPDAIGSGVAACNAELLVACTCRQLDAGRGGGGGASSALLLLVALLHRRRRGGSVGWVAPAGCLHCFPSGSMTAHLSVYNPCLTPSKLMYPCLTQISSPHKSLPRTNPPLRVGWPGGSPQPPSRGAKRRPQRQVKQSGRPRRRPPAPLPPRPQGAASSCAWWQTEAQL